jgi:Bifunctional DNA primase/polymerase, N-terminal/Primase C terminal 2 (PriCT-2)
MGINAMNPNRHPADEHADLRDPYEEYLQQQAEQEAEWEERYQAHLEELDLAEAESRAHLREQEQEQAEARIADEDFSTPMFRAVEKLVRQHCWRCFPANLELEPGNTKFNKKSYLSKEHAPGGENWGMTNDLKQLELNFCEHHWRNKCGIGVPTGADNEIFVIEADTPKGHDVDGIAALKALEAEHGALPETLKARSPSGSLHFYFKHPGKGLKVWNSSSTLAPGVDVRGDGGMVVAPPSKRGDGVYRWLNELPIAEAPTWLLDLVTEHDTSRKKDSSKSKKDSRKSDAAAAAGKKKSNAAKKKSNGAAPPLPEAEMTAEEAAAAYVVIPNDDADWETYNRLGMAGWRATAGEGFAGFDAWAQKSGKYNARNTIERWQAYFKSPPTQIGAGTLIMLANEADPGWREAYRAKAKQEQPEQAAWPTLAPEALYGLAGEVVSTIEPHSESDPVALQLQFMAAFGNSIGRGRYVLVEGTRHYTNLFGLLVGATSKSRKGTSGDRIRQVMKLVDPVWEEDRILGGCHRAKD